MKLSTPVLIAGALAIALVLWLAFRQSSTVRPPLTLGVRADGSILDSLNAGASKVRTFFGTLFGGSSSAPVYTDAAPGDSNTLPGEPYYGPGVA